MPLKSKKFLMSTLILFILINSTNTSFASSIEDEQPFVIMYDEGHGQFFDRILYNGALTLLENSVDVNYKILFNTDRFNSTLLQGIDLLVITNPNSSFNSDERYYIGQFLEKGNSLMMMSNPFDETNTSLNGRGDKFNDVLGNPELDTVDLQFWVDNQDIGDYKRTDIVKNEFNNLGNDSSILEIEINETDHEILNYQNSNVNTVITKSSTVRARQVVLSASYEAYSEKPSGDKQYQATQPLILGLGVSTTTNYKVIVCGSTIMFSDLKNPALDDEPSWLNSEDNAILWKNIFLWFAEYESTSDDIIDTLGYTLLFMSILTVFGSGFIVLGSVIYNRGSNIEFKMLKQEIKDDKSKKEDDPISTQVQKESKKSRRLKQLQKSTKK